jgi:methylornithine synthase
MTPLTAAHTAIHREEEQVAAFLDKVAERAGIASTVMIRLLESPTPELAETLFTAARRLRERHFGNRVFLYGFLYISTHCRNRCRFCLYRKDNESAVRYRKTLDQIIASARQLARTGVHLIDLTAGEDPRLHHSGTEPFNPVVRTVRAVREATELPVMASVGVVTESDLERLAAAGADWYACYQETHNRLLFKQLRAGQDYEKRFQSKVAAKAKGLLIEEGLLCGVGETGRDVVHSFNAMERLAADQVRAMTFVPQQGTPMQDRPAPMPLRELMVIALMRVAFPHLLIPASLDVDGLAGLRRRLDAGANVVTSLVPPGQGLAGVAQGSKDIEDGRRTVAGIAATLHDCRLAPSTVAQYHEWMERRRRAAAVDVCRETATC